MRISELARVSGVTIATIKYYVREGLLPAGAPTSATQAEYGDVHVERLRLIRALVEVGGLSLTTVGELLQILDSPAGADPRATLARAVATAHHALSARTAPGTASARPDPGKGPRADERADRKADQRADQGADHGAGQGIEGADRAGRGPEPARARAAMAALGWQVDPDAPTMRQLEAALAALEAVGLPPGEETLRTYAQAALTVAQADVGSVPVTSEAGAGEAVRHVVLGTVMYEPVLTALRRLAQEHVFRSSGPGS